MTDFQKLAARGLAESIAIAGETVTIGPWTGLAIVDGGGDTIVDVTGGTYRKVQLTLLVSKAALGNVVPVEQMDVTARGLDCRIPDDGITEDVDSYLIKVAGRNVPQ